MPNHFRNNRTLAAIMAMLFSTGSAFSSAAIGAEDATASQAAKSPSTPAAETATSTSSSTPAAAPTAAAAPADKTTTAPAADTDAGPKIPFKPGQTLTTATDTEDIVATYDIELAKKQCAAYPDSPEAAFILAVALTRTSRVEEALKQVQNARRLAESKGGPVYFDKMIASYEQMLKSYPDDNQVRYGLAWAYYMKAYLLAKYSRATAQWKKHIAEAEAAKAASGANKNATTSSATTGTTAAVSPASVLPTSIVNNKDVVKALSGGNANSLAALATAAASLTGNTKLPPESLPHIPTALEKAEPGDIPQIKHFYELALTKLDEILKREPDDVWTIVYRAHLKAEYTGDLDEAMKTWRAVEAKHPNNPAPFFFLGEGYLKQGNLKESINHVSRAIALRALGN